MAKKKSGLINWLLAIPYVAVLWVPFYNSAEPAVFGFPMFYWYQLLWVVLCSLLVGIVYMTTKSTTRDGA